MEKIASFTIDHLKLVPGVYVSRKDTIGREVITTFDLRMTSPNDEPVMNTAEVHTIEHLAATFLRNHPVYGNKTIYFGPMGCRTGFYLLLAGDLTSKKIVPLMIEMFEFIRDFKDEVPGASPKDCGNYLDMNLPMANYLAKRYLDNVLYNIDDSRLIYPAGTISQKTVGVPLPTFLPVLYSSNVSTLLCLSGASKVALTTASFRSASSSPIRGNCVPHLTQN